MSDLKQELKRWGLNAELLLLKLSGLSFDDRKDLMLHVFRSMTRERQLEVLSILEKNVEGALTSVPK